MRWRLVAVMVALVALVLVVHDLPLASYLRRVERDRLVTALERDAFILSGRMEEGLEDDVATDDPELTRLVTDYSERTGARVIVTDGDGQAQVTSDAEAAVGSDYSTRPEIVEALGGSPTSGQRFSRTLDQELLYVAVPVLSGGDVRGAVRITYPSSVIDDRVESRVRGLATVALISILSAAAVALLLVGTVTRPLRRLRTATEQLAAGDLSVRAPADEGPPEVRALASSFDSMAERLQALVDRQRAFAGDASHQLRTPLTALRLRLEQASDLLDFDPDGARQRIEAASAETERLQHLVDGLLVLARAEEGGHAREPVDLAALARERAEVWAPLAEEQGRTVVVSAPDSLGALAVAGAVEQVIDNYVDNALAVAPLGSAVEIEVAIDGGRAVVHVRDRGPGMTQDELAHAFDRFWRARGAQTQGSGLGLAIVAQLARASGGSAELRARDGGGTDAAAWFPSVPLPQPSTT